MPVFMNCQSVWKVGLQNAGDGAKLSKDHVIIFSKTDPSFLKMCIVPNFVEENFL